MKDVLIVIDMQNDFIDGSLGTKEAQAIVSNVKNKVDEYLVAGHKVIFTKDTHYDNYLETYEGMHLPVAHCIDGTDGHKISKELLTNEVREKVADDEVIIISKNTFGYIHWSELKAIYTAKDYEICGLCTDICVISNALILRANYPNKDIVVDSSCCAGVTPELHEAALKVMASNQIEVI